MSPDPLGGDITNPQSLNRYAYALNNPTTLTDPLGLTTAACLEVRARAMVSGQIGSCGIYDGTGTGIDFGGPVGAGSGLYGSLESTGVCAGDCQAAFAMLNSEGNYWGIGVNGPFWQNANGYSTDDPSDEASGEWGAPLPDPGGVSAAPCPTRIIGAVNKTFATNLSTANVSPSLTFNYHNTLNLVFQVPASSAATFIAGRYPLSGFSKATGIGVSLHLPTPGLWDPTAIYGMNGNMFQFSAHLDSSYPTVGTPIGFVIHVFADVLGYSIFHTGGGCPR